MAKIDLTPPTTPPNAANETLRLFNEAGFKFTPEIFERINELLDALVDDHNELFWSLVGIWGLAGLIGQQGDPASSEALTAHMRTLRARFPKLDEEITALLETTNSSVLKKFRASVGEDSEPKRAPVFGAAAPKGATKLSDLMPPDRLRPPMPRKK